MNTVTLYIKRDNKPVSFGVNYNDLGQFDTSMTQAQIFFKYS